MQRYFILLLIVLMPVSGLAQSGDEARAQLQSTKEAIKAASERQKQIEAKRQKLREELKTLQKEMVKLAGDTGSHEQELSGYEDKMGILEDQKKQKNDQLSVRQAELSDLISAMIRIRELPPETIIAMPGKIDETLAAARALNLISHAIQEEADGLKGQLHELSDLEDKIRKNREAIVTGRKELTARRTALEAKIKERTDLEDELGTEDEDTKSQIEQLTAKSQNLEELVEALGKAEEPQFEEEHNVPSGGIRKNQRYSDERELRSFVDAKGHIRMPAAGKIIRHFGGSGQDSALSRGITIQTREGASVVAPYDGQVVYAGNFRDYGRIVIIRHTDDYHTLLSGMDRINCTPGQFLMQGEPIGSMGRPEEARRLYMEVRKSRTPVDPMPWLGRS